MLTVIQEQIRHLRWFFSVALLSIASLLVLGACDNSTTEPTDQVASNVLYIVSNVPMTGQNSVLGYRRAADGTLTALPGSPFLTGGAGTANPGQILGPDDVDFPLAVNANHRRLFAVNPGSNTIAVFDIQSDGGLIPVAGSPFPSGGINPVSVAVKGNQLFVVNKAQDPGQSSSALPNYTAFTIASSGSLTPIAGSTITTIAGASPQLALLSPSGNVLFGADFMAPGTPSHQGSLRAFAVSAAGTLTAAPGTPLDIPGPADPMTHVVLGLATHPTQNVLYVGFVAQNKLGVYRFDPASGAMTFQTTASNSGKAICWIVTNKSGSAIYTTNTADNSVSFYNASNPLAPTEAQRLALKEPGPMFINDKGMMMPTSEDFQLTLDPSGQHLYILSQHANPDFSVTNGNLLHILTVAADGTLSEPAAPLHLPVDTRTRPWGVLAF